MGFGQERCESRPRVFIGTLMFSFGECCACGFGWWLIGQDEITIESRERITLERGKSVL